MPASPVPTCHSLTGIVTYAAPILAAHPRTRQLAAYALLVVGLGGMGVGWERLCGADLRRLHGCRRRLLLTDGGGSIVSHVPHVAAAVVLLRAGGRRG